MGESTEEPKVPADLEAEAPDDVDPETLALARRAFHAVLEGDRSALASVASQMPGAATLAPPSDARVRAAVPGSVTMQSFPAQGSPAAPSSSSRWIAIVAGAAIGATVLGVGAFVAVRSFRQERLTATPCGRGALKLFGDLHSPVTVTLFANKGLPKMDRFVEQVSAMMRDLEARSNGKLVYELVEVHTDDERIRAKEAGLQETAFGDSAKGEAATILRGFCGMEIRYGTEREVIPVLSPEQPRGVPFWIVQKIREVRARADNAFQRFGVISGNEGVRLTEPNLVPTQMGRGSGPTMKGIFEQAMPFYKLEELDLKGGEEEIDPQYSALLVTQPGADLTDKELRRIDQFLMRGGKSAVVFASAVNLKAGDSTMKADLGLRGLDKLLSGYGIEVQSGALFDWGSSLSIPFVTQAGVKADVRAPSLIVIPRDERSNDATQRLDHTFVPFFRLDELAVPFASPLVVHAEKQPEARFRVVARTSENTTLETASPVPLRPTAEAVPRGEKGQKAIGVAVEGKLRSAFAGQPGDGVQAPASAPESSRLFVVSSSQFLANPLARAGNAPPQPGMEMLGAAGGDEELQLLAQGYAQKYLTSTILVLKNTLDWASADDATVSCSALLLGPKEEKN